MAEGSSNGGFSGISLPPPVQKVIVTVLLGGAAYIVTLLTGQNQIWGITLSVFFGGIVFVIQFLIEVDGRLQNLQTRQLAHQAAVENLVKTGFSRISEVTELFGLVEASRLQTEIITQLLRNCTSLGEHPSELVYRFAQSEILRISDLLKGLSEGNAVYEGEDRDWLLGLSRGTQTSLNAISLAAVDSSGFWSSGLGRHYVEIQRELVDNGVQIRRIFIVDDMEQVREGPLRPVCALQSEIGIDVRVLDTARIPDTRRDLLYDFIVFDGAISYETTPAPFVGNGRVPTIVNTRLVLDTARVAGRIRLFEDLWKSAQPLARQQQA